MMNLQRHGLFCSVKDLHLEDLGPPIDENVLWSIEWHCQPSTLGLQTYCYSKLILVLVKAQHRLSL